MPEINAVLTDGWVVAATLFTALATAALTWAEASWRPGKGRIAVWMTKPLASLGFLLTALLAGAWGSSFGQLVFVGLLLGAVGDVLLIPEGKGASFKLGTASFLGGHLVFVYAFFAGGLFTGWSWLAIAAMACIGTASLRAFWPHARGVMRPLLVAYIVVIALMAVSATGMTVASRNVLYLTAAGLFVASDILVARDRFIRQRPINRAVSLPMYYLAQLMFALAAGAGL